MLLKNIKSFYGILEKTYGFLRKNALCALMGGSHFRLTPLYLGQPKPPLCKGRGTAVRRWWDCCRLANLIITLSLLNLDNPSVTYGDSSQRNP